MYCMLLMDQLFEATHEDRANLRRIMVDNGEPKFFRAVAAETFAMLQWLQKKREKAAGLLREGIFYCESSGEGADQDATLLICPDRSGRKLSVLEGRLTVNDEELAIIIWGRRASQDATTPRRINFTPRCKNVPPHLLDRTFVGGRACDACGTPREELGIPNIPCCTRCRRVFYCSRECQTRHRPRHTPHCRRKRDFRRDDILKLDHLTSKPELNGELVRAISPQEGEDRWGVRVLSSGRRISVSRQNLEFIRPPT
jgi:hypothetical protein